MDNSSSDETLPKIGFRLAPGAVLPKYETAGASCFDISACIPDELGVIEIKRGCGAIIPTGLFPVIPENYELQVRPRSGYASKQLMLIPNSPATIDADYRGELFVTLYNASAKDVTVSHQQRIAQGRLCEAPQNPVVEVTAEEYNALPATKRGAGGFGSTGLK